MTRNTRPIYSTFSKSVNLSAETFGDVAGTVAEIRIRGGSVGAEDSGVGSRL